VLNVIHDFIMADLGAKMHLYEVLLLALENIRNAQNAQSNFGDTGMDRT
jgi:hypothetical protein